VVDDEVDDDDEGDLGVIRVGSMPTGEATCHCGKSGFMSTVTLSI